MSHNTDKIAEQILEFVGILHKDIFRRKDESGEFDKGGQMAVLFTLEKKGRCQMSELGRYLGVSKPNITFLVDRLQEDGMINRLKDPADRRVINIEITDAGIQYIGEKKMQLIERVKTKLTVLDAEDMKTLEDSLNKLLGIFTKIKNEEEG